MHAIVLVLLLQQSQPLANAAQAADAALAKQSYAQARDAYVQALAVAEREGNKQEAWRANFYLGLTSEFLADTASDPAALLSQAANYYETAASIQPSARIANNLALLRARQGKHDEARALFTKAIAANDDHRALYEQNYAAFLHKIGQEREALTYYRHATRTITPTDELHNTIVQLALRVDARELARYLTDLNRRGSPRVIPTAISALESERAASAQDELVNVLAQALSRTTLDTDTPAQLRATKHPGAVQLAALFDERPSLQTFSWWTRGDMVSLDAFRQLTRTLGRQREVAHQPEAGYYYRLAADSGETPDEQALIDLASYYASSRRRDELDGLVRRFESHARATTAYEFHRAAGVMYARLKQWSNPAEPAASAIYQLEHAELARKAINVGAARPEPADAGVYVLLADGYAATGREASATRARLDAAQTYLASGDKEAARDALAPFALKPPTALDDRKRYGDLVATLGAPLEKSSPFNVPERDQTPYMDRAMMEAMMKAATPGEAHKHLNPLVGVWNTKITMWMAPGGDPLTSQGTAEARWVLGNRYIEQRLVGNFMGMPFEGVGYTGYDSLKKQYWGTWMDNMSTSAMMSTGYPSPDGKTLTFSGANADPMTGKETTIQERLTIIDSDNYSLETWAPGPDGKLIKMMEISYSRKK